MKMMKKLWSIIIIAMVSLSCMNYAIVPTKAKSLGDIADKALEKLGCVYKLGECHTLAKMQNTETKLFDCSGLVNWATYQSGYYIGIHRARTLLNIGTEIAAEDMQKGDIILFGKSSTPTHTGIYIGNDKFVHAPHTGDVVKTTSTTCSYFTTNFICARRIRSSDIKGASKIVTNKTTSTTSSTSTTSTSTTTVTTTTTVSTNKTNAKATVDIEKAKINSIADQVYAAKKLTPALTIKYDSKTLKKGTDYTVAYADNKAVGEATVTITGKGSYTGTTKVHFNIVPKGTSLTSVVKNNKKMTVKWSKQATQTSGYEVQYSTSATFKSGNKTAAVTKTATVSKTITGLTASKTYYVRVRTYKTVNGKKYYSDWSDKKATAKEETKSTKISDAKITEVADQVYTGKKITPALTIKLNDKKLKKGTDYTVTYTNNKAVGQATATVKAKGSYTGTTKVTFNIVPKAVKIKSVKAGTKKVTVSWMKQAAQTNGYEVQYSTSATFKSGNKTKKVTKTSTVSKVLSGLKAKKTYYVRVRAYKTVKGKAYYSDWSKTLKAKTK